MIAQPSARSRAARRQWRDPLARARLLAGQLLAHERRRVRQLVEDNLGLLDLTAGLWVRKFPSVPREDLHSSALPGLLLAARRWDPTHPSGASFRTYAFQWLRASVQEALPELLAEHGIRLPRQAAAPRPSTSSLDLEGRVSRIASRDEHADPIAHAIAAEDAARIRSALGRLRNERDARVVAMRFGLDGDPPMHLREIGEVLGVGVERVRQLELRALAELRHLLGE